MARKTPRVRHRKVGWEEREDVRRQEAVEVGAEAEERL